MDEMYKKANKQKIRFQYKGPITVEDLFDLGTDALDGIYKSLNTEAKLAQEDSLLKQRSHKDDEVLLKIEIVKDIVTDKLAEKDAAILMREKRQQKQRIAQILNEKKDEALASLPIAELEKLLED
jgi:hypothetical protein